jgi:retron-type reverse transcriptase
MTKHYIGPLLRQALTRSALRTAWHKVADNQGAAGSDGEQIGDIARHLDEVLTDLARSVVAGHYQPRPLRRVWLARPGKTPRGLAACRTWIVESENRPQ